MPPKFDPSVNVEVYVPVTVQNRQAIVSVVLSAAALLIKVLKESERDRKKVKNTKHSGIMSLDDVIEIPKIMKNRSVAKDLSGTVKQILGTCVSVGCTVDGKDPKATPASPSSSPSRTVRPRSPSSGWPRLRRSVRRGSVVPSAEAPSSMAKDLSGAVKKILRTCVSVSCTVDGKDLQPEVTDGDIKIPQDSGTELVEGWGELQPTSFWYIRDPDR